MCESLTIKNMWMLKMLGSAIDKPASITIRDLLVLVSDCQYLSSSSETKQVQGYVHEGRVYYE